MKRIFYLLLYLYANAASAQDFDGVYLGRLVSDKNVLVVSTTAGTAVGTIYLNKAEKINFIGTISNGALLGSFRHNNTSWNINGSLKNDSLLIKLASNNGSILTRLKRLSDNTSYKFSKLLNEAPSNDIQVVGTWRALYSIKDGVKEPVDSKAKGLTQIYKQGGDCQIQSIELDILYNKNPKSIPKCYWETLGGKLITTIYAGNNPYSIETQYLVKGDTLILTYKGTDSYFLRSGK